MPAEFFAPIYTHTTPPVYKYFTGSSWEESETHATISVPSPINGEILGEVQAVGKKEIDGVLVKARNAVAPWQKVPVEKRAKMVHLAADWLRHFESYFTTLLIKEIGKPHDDAQSEVLRSADFLDYAADIAMSLHGETIQSGAFPGYADDREAMVDTIGVGVVAALAPFNYPINLAVSKIGPALLMGNACVFKPPTQGAIVGVHVAQIFHKAGFPDGIISCVTGLGKDIGEYIASHAAVNMVAFTGSSEVGESLGKSIGMKPMLFECGGNNPVVVFPDADMHEAAREIVKGAFSYAGQRCTAIKYVLGTPGTLEKLIPLVEKEVKQLVHMGDPRSPETKLMGPLISPSAADNVEKAIAEAVKKGAKVISGGERKNSYIPPTILTDVTPAMRIVKEEIFGPVLSFIEVKHGSQAADIINTSDYGLQASVFTKDEGTGVAFAKLLQVGSIQINGSPQRGPDHFPFLGIKKSGLGVQGVKYSLQAMSRPRPIIFNQPK